MTVKSLYQEMQGDGCVAHEVVKRVGGRAYRYRVESYRDAATKKVRSRWTYVGRGAIDADVTPASPAQPRRAGRDTRERLIDAFERLLDEGNYAAVTSGAVARTAGFAHGTFYRYFTDKRALLLATLERLRDELDRVRPSFDPPYGGGAAERARVGAWVEAVLSRPAAHPGVLRAWYDMLEVDEPLRSFRLARRAERVTALGSYLEKLAAAGTIALEKPAPLATALAMVVDAALRAAVVEAAVIDEATIAGVAALFDRSIFGPMPPGAGASASMTGGISATDNRPESTLK